MPFSELIPQSVVITNGKQHGSSQSRERVNLNVAYEAKRLETSCYGPCELIETRHNVAGLVDFEIGPERLFPMRINEFPL